MDLGCRMLVADGSAATRQIIREAAARAHMPVMLLEATNGNECKALITKGHVQLAFIDIDMPGLSGIEVVLAARQAGIKTFFTFMSAREDDELFDIARQLKVYEFLAKPFRISNVQTIIRTYNHLTSPLRALIVDESETIPKLIEKLLARSIFRLTLEQADTGAGAVALCRSEWFDVVFLDCDMPQFNGLTALKQLRKHNPSIKAVMISGRRKPVREQTEAQPGVTAFMSKPFSVDQVDAALHQLYGLPIPMLKAPPARINPHAREFITDLQPLRTISNYHTRDAAALNIGRPDAGLTTKAGMPSRSLQR
jgi:CheY-like chemotaxis protein